MAFKNLKKFEFRLGRQGIILFTVGMSLLLFIVFIFGVMTGIHIDAYPEKIAHGIPQIIAGHLGLSPVKDDAGLVPTAEESNQAPLVMEPVPHQPPLAALEPVAANQGPVAGEGYLTPPADGAKEGEPAQKPLPAETAKKEAIPAKSPVPTEAAHKESIPAVKPAPTAVAEKKNKLEKKIPAAQATAPPKEKEKVEKKYTLQVVSFKNREQADQLCKKISALGYNPHVAVVDIPDKGKWFRVVIGKLKTEEEAKKAAAVLSGKIKGVNCIVRQAK